MKYSPINIFSRSSSRNDVNGMPRDPIDDLGLFDEDFTLQPSLSNCSSLSSRSQLVADKSQRFVFEFEGCEPPKFHDGGEFHLVHQIGSTGGLSGISSAMKTYLTDSISHKSAYQNLFSYDGVAHLSDYVYSLMGSTLHASNIDSNNKCAIADSRFSSSQVRNLPSSINSHPWKATFPVSNKLFAGNSNFGANGLYQGKWNPVLSYESKNWRNMASSSSTSVRNRPNLANNVLSEVFESLRDDVEDATNTKSLNSNRHANGTKSDCSAREQPPNISRSISGKSRGSSSKQNASLTSGSGSKTSTGTHSMWHRLLQYRLKKKRSQKNANFSTVDSDAAEVVESCTDDTNGAKSKGKAKQKFSWRNARMKLTSKVGKKKRTCVADLNLNDNRGDLLLTVRIEKMPVIPEEIEGLSDKVYVEKIKIVRNEKTHEVERNIHGGFLACDIFACVQLCGRSQS